MGEPIFYDRDLSWLSFNERVLMQAQSESVPLLERLRFIAIYSSNLDEFFRVRVAGIRSLLVVDKKKINRKAGLDPQDTLDRIHSEVTRQLTIYGATLDSIVDQLTDVGLMIVRDPADFTQTDLIQANYFFKTQMLGYLRPVQLVESKGATFIHNQQLYLVVKLKENEEITFGLVNVPADKLPRFLRLKRDTGEALAFLDDILRTNIERVFPKKEILEIREIKLNKDADLQIDDEFAGDLVSKIEAQIKKRDLGRPSRLLFESGMSVEMQNALKVSLNLSESDMVAGGRHHNLSDFWQIRNPGPAALEFSPMPALQHAEIDEHYSLFDAVDQRDRLLHFPYQTYDYVLQFFNEAASDPDVKEIDVTFYRMAENSLIGEALISAARNGKEVFVFMELKARFDEKNNLYWAQRFEDAGVKIVYSMPGLKVHAKVALVTKRGSDGKKAFYGFYGTGNLNEKTAQVYSDFGLFTNDKALNKELARVFKFLHRKKQPKEFSSLIVSQFGAIEKFTQLIDDEIAIAKEGRKAEITIKLNNIEEQGLISKLYEASDAGVAVTVIARSVCCLVPDHCGITVIRLVDRFLEHARIFHFRNDGDPLVYLGSSDWMNRNLFRRVEVSFPIADEHLKNEILETLELQKSDNTNAVLLNERMENVIQTSPSGEPINAQKAIYESLSQRKVDF